MRDLWPWRHSVCEEMHRHMRCVGLDYMPRSWLCAPCLAVPVFVIRHVTGKRILRNRTEYKVRWVGHPTWEALTDVPRARAAL